MNDKRPGSAEPRFGRTRTGNQLLAALPEAVLRQVEPHLQRVSLKAGESLFQAHEPLGTAFFPDSGVISLIAQSKDDETLEVGVVGCDGMVGVALIPGVNMLPYDAIVQVAGTARRIRAEALKEAVRNFGPFHELLGRYAYSVFAAGVQTAVCNNFHPVSQRCARWLLMLHDLALDDGFPLTQTLLAQMLGVRRPSVTLAAHALQREGVLEYHHGRMAIRDRSKLEASACGCYLVLRGEQQRLLGY